MDVRTIEPHYQWQNKAENMIKIIDVVQPQDVPFGIILWYIAKIIPTLLEQDQFVMQISHVNPDMDFPLVHSIEDRSQYYNIKF